MKSQEVVGVGVQTTGAEAMRTGEGPRRIEAGGRRTGPGDKRTGQGDKRTEAEDKKIELPSTPLISRGICLNPATKESRARRVMRGVNRGGKR